MHELPFTKNILVIALKHAEEVNAEKIKTIYLRIGILRDMDEEWLQKYFRYISKDTIAADAELVVMVEPVVCKCHECGEQFGVDLKKFADDEELSCPQCEMHDYELVAGDEFIIQGIELE